MYIRQPNLTYDPLIVCKQENAVKYKLCQFNLLNFFATHFFDIVNIDVSASVCSSVIGL